MENDFDMPSNARVMLFFVVSKTFNLIRCIDYDGQPILIQAVFHFNPFTKLK